MIKPATTYVEQINILKSRNITITNEEFCADVLGTLNYYRLTAYMLPFKNTKSNSYSSARQIYEWE